MKSVYLIRHAKSSWEMEEVDDHERPLNERGYEDAPIMAEYLYSQHVKPNMVLCSTSKRTKQTYACFAQFFKGVPLHLSNALYHASSQGIMNQIHTLSSNYPVLFIFCHNPGIENFLYKVTGKDIKVPTCTVIRFDFDIIKWSTADFDNARFVSMFVPKDVKK